MRQFWSSCCEEAGRTSPGYLEGSQLSTCTHTFSIQPCENENNAMFLPIGSSNVNVDLRRIDISLHKTLIRWTRKHSEPLKLLVSFDRFILSLVGVSSVITVVSVQAFSIQVPAEKSSLVSYLNTDLSCSNWKIPSELPLLIQYHQAALKKNNT